MCSMPGNQHSEHHLHKFDSVWPSIFVRLSSHYAWVFLIFLKKGTFGS